ncbi:hypothetical protein [Actinoalloteichus hymeniacidonis]|uniref:Uncharacterized protein n=1 Tax=Actinoalloteichus hymeniacidonis TaxID=340345 RepID=A0AAC9HTE2_9PSEU|nr:hypothetical protein [Actinoalloteichus hymeniacidonis]AOS64781.1 hypothetical protein TL08_19950 [Actinoalloteichus hymeniacidonis]MBB5907143.1 hypothetical protein [Actinoalloteichus hymeniacidonis]
MALAAYLGMVSDAQRSLATALRKLGSAHPSEPDFAHLGAVLAGRIDTVLERLDPLIEHYGARPQSEPELLRIAGSESGERSGGVGLLRDLQDAHLLASFVATSWTVVDQAGQALRDRRLLAVVAAGAAETERQLTWLRTRIAQSAPQALLA